MKTWRTLLRTVSFTEDQLELCIPGIAWDRTFWVPKSIIPFDVAIVDYRFHAKVNLEAETAEELMLSDFEKF